MGGVIVEVGDASWGELQTLLEHHHVPFIEVGATQEAASMDVELADGSFSVTLDVLRDVHTGKLAEVIYG